MMYGNIILSSIVDFLWVVLAALVFSWVFRKARLPPILGAMIAGLLLGPSGLNVIHLNQNPLAYQWLIFLGSMGGLILIFLVGLESNIREIISFSKEGISIGLFGLFVSFVLVSSFGIFMGLPVIQALVLGTALSISSSIPALTTIMSMRKGSTRAAKIFSVSSLVDDIFGLILLFLVITSFSGGGFNLLSFLGFLIILAVFWIVSLTVIPRISSWAYRYFDYPSEQTTTLLTLIFIIIAAVISEDFLYEAGFGVFLVGLAFSTLHPLYKYEIKKIFLNLGDILLFPAFFIMIGLNANLRALADPYWLGLALGILVLASLGKILGPLISKFISKLSVTESLAIGLSLIPRGGITLVIGALAMSKGLISEGLFASLVILVVITTVLAPFLTAMGFSKVKS